MNTNSKENYTEGNKRMWNRDEMNVVAAQDAGYLKKIMRLGSERKKITQVDFLEEGKET